jgi:hypothetical protein
MAQHRPPPVGRNKMVSGYGEPETLTNQNNVLVWSKILAGQTILYTDGGVMSTRGHDFASRPLRLKPLPRSNPEHIHLSSGALRPRLSLGVSFARPSASANRPATVLVHAILRRV